ncbi:TIGR01244 family phosphatase [Comamonadaceae bacterium M7527]|nr:TIGR01244 family phosphatase [Comamonadaceae bacterium M7527]
MDIKHLSTQLSVTPQITQSDLTAIAAAGFKSIVCNRPDGEGADQPTFVEIEQAAKAAGLQAAYLPADSGKVTDDQGMAFGQLMAELPGPMLAYCRTGTRCATMWALAQAPHTDAASLLHITANAGFDLSGLATRLANLGSGMPVADGQATTSPRELVEPTHQILIIGGGAAGISVASSLLARQPNLDIAIVDPATVHYYQPGWTMVGGGIFDATTTARSMASVLPSGVVHIQAAVVSFEPEQNAVTLEGCRTLRYQQLIVCPGLKLNWDGIEGLKDTLGKNGVTSNYRYDLAPYTWELVQNLKRGKAIFTQPPMPIKCAGAPQKAMYLSSDHWRRSGVLNDIDIDFCNAGGVLFGVAAYVPALMEYVETYGINLRFNRNLVAVDGTTKQATFKQTKADGEVETVVQDFDMLHVVPPQTAPDFIRQSPLADAAGWVDIDPATMRHKQFANVHALGDVGNTTNAKTAAAARKQAPVVAHNVLVALGKLKGQAHYDGYGSCPLTVERGKIVLAEFLYGGKVAPSFPSWLIDGTKPSALAWYLKERILPPLYWNAMLKGREWLAGPAIK